MNAKLQEKLAAIDPTTLKAGPEIDALVAACLGWETKEGQAVVEMERAGRTGGSYDPSDNDRWHNKRVWLKDGKRVACEECGTLPNWSEYDGIAFSDLWPWLLGKDHSLSLVISFRNGKPAVIKLDPDSGKWEYIFSEADTWALALCRAMVTVAKKINIPQSGT